MSIFKKTVFKQWFLLDLRRNKEQRESWKAYQYSIQQLEKKDLK